jgi:tripartite-type tricarboxylate transporter receptor subunit TctC
MQVLAFKNPTPFFVAAAVLSGALAASANAQTWPDRAIHLVVPAGPGGPTDVLARLIADRLQPALGQPVIVPAARSGRARSQPRRPMATH